LEQLSFLDLPLLLGPALFPAGKPLAGSVTHPLLPLAHMDGIDGEISGDHLDRPPATHRLHGDPGLELGAVRVELAHWWEPLSAAVPLLRG
jgi:hypothetical protein